MQAVAAVYARPGVMQQHHMSALAITTQVIMFVTRREKYRKVHIIQCSVKRPMNSQYVHGKRE